MDKLYLYNTLSRQKELFQAINPPKVTLYTCGPTVYDDSHIGNYRTYIFEDILRRTLEMNGYIVTQGMNITDVGHLVGDGDEGEDKLEVGANREGKHPLEVAKKYEEKFFKDLQKLAIEKPSFIESATQAIEAQIELIQRLEEKGVIYKTPLALYFDVTKIDDYGKLTGQNLQEKMQAVRDEVVSDPNKRHPSDFAVWFFLAGRYKNHVLHWPSPWGEGFPGWHVECSAIARHLLGQPIDIHTGGVDHIGTHHTNEIAQSEIAYGVPLAHYWVHGEFLQVEGKRMGKSEGNFVTLDTIEGRGFSPLDFRYLCLTAHYRSKMNFTWEALASAHKTRLFIATSPEGDENHESLESVIWQALLDDLDTPKALALLHQAKSKNLWLKFDPVLGLNIENMQAQTKKTITQEAQTLLLQRTIARQNKQWDQADYLRQKLEKLGYTTVDTDDDSYLK